MNNSSYRQPETEINLMEVLWNLLSQWKAVLLAALIMACLVAGAKYYKDTSAYNSAKKELRAMEETATTAEGRIEEILAELPEKDRSTVEFVLEQKDWIDRQTEYINDSILLNADPENQRRLRLNYCIETSSRNIKNTKSLLYSYSELLRSEKSVKTIKKALDTETDDRYIAELIGTGDSGTGDSGTGDSGTGDSGTGDSGTGDSGGMGKIIFLVNIMMPEEADSDAVEKAITAILSEYEPTLSSEIASHSIKLMSANESYVYNTGAVDRRTSLINNINNLGNSTRNIQNNLTSEQKDAIEQISAIKNEERMINSSNTSDEEAATESPKPALSRKYALLGFILGCFAYAAVYLIWLILRGRVNNASDLESITGARLIGEIYEIGERKSLLQRLAHSPRIEKLHYKGRLDADKQIEKLAASVEAICEHDGLKSLTLLNAAQSAATAEQSKGDGADSAIDSAIKKLTEICKKKDVILNTIRPDSEFSEKDLSAAKDALILADRETQNKMLWDVMSTCSVYDTNIRGAVFKAEL